MKIQVLIPHYQETREEMEPLLGSIALQQCVDMSEVGVVIAYDGPDATDLPLDEWRERYPYRIEDVHPHKGGVSATRNAALDASTADYVMFCDADDMFYSVTGLWQVLRETEGDGFDTLTSFFLEETRDPKTKKPTYVNHQFDSTFVHGKVHRRAYLVENGIRFNDVLTVHEDSYFNILAQSLAKEFRYCGQAFYLWKWRDDSVCRHDPKYILKTYNHMLKSNDALVCEFLRREMPDKATTYCVSMIFDAYYTMNKSDWLDVENAEYRDAVEREFAAYYRRHRDLWDSVSDMERMVISRGVRDRSVDEGMQMEQMTISQWLEHVESL